MQPPISTTLQSNSSRHGSTPGASPAARGPLVGVFETLVTEHRKAAELMARIPGQSAASRQQSWPIVRRQLLSHDRAEELEIYAALEGYDGARDILEHHKLDAAELEGAINELDGIDYESDQWMEKLRDVVALFDDHVRDEETEYFPRMQQLLGEDKARDLHERFVSAQREVIHTLV
jgi:hemerythrin superfamily protein